MKKELLVLLLAVVVISGCKQTASNLPDTSQAYSGSDGLTMMFLQNAPPSVAPSGSYIPVGLFLENRGAADINNGVIVLSYPEDTLTLDVKSFAVNLEGKETFPAGGKSFNVVDGRVKKVEKIGTEKPKARISATSCYDYATKLNSGICINPDPYGIKSLTGKRAACEAKTLSFSSQGAPVAITRVEPITLPRGNTVDIRIKAFIDNRNSGTIYRKGGNTYCTSGKTELGIVNGKASLLGVNVVCTPESLKLSDRSDENYITCYFNGISAPEAFVTQLSIVLEYGYSSSVSKDLSIEVVESREVVQSGCERCGPDGYIGMAGSPGCQNFGEKSYLTALHKKCLDGCIQLYPDFTTNPPTEC